jgi:hypothetical protein
MTTTLSLHQMSMADAHLHLRDKVGRTIRLTTQTNNQEQGTEWRINSVNKLGSTVVVSAGPVNGKGRGYFFPYNTFELVDAAKPTEPEPQLSPKLPSRDEFAFIGADAASPLYKTFRTCAPQTPEALDLYRLYSNEYSEYDTDLLDDTLRLFDIMPDQHWTNELVSNLTRLFQGAIDLVLGPPPELFVAPEPQAVLESRHDAIVLESRHDEVVLESRQEEVEVAEIIEQEIASEPRRRGRPPGSKNKPKTLEEQVQQSETQHAATIVRKQPKPQWEDDIALGTISNGFATMTVGEFQKKFSVTEVPDVNLQADENFEAVYTDLKDKHFQKELHIFVGQMLEYLNNTATDPQTLLQAAVGVVSTLI